VQYDFDADTDRPGTGYTALASAMIRGALVDMAGEHPKHRKLAASFFAGVWFDVLADAAGLDPLAVRERLQARGLLR